ncbi:MAG: hypothetical protein LBE13_11850, partial [Bacteroidales bacterium]|nr:hypothetical protein [Bacteroidales bacterium]
MKRQSIIILIFFLFIPFLVFSDTGERYYEAEGKFSICPPKNWAVTSLPGLKYKIIYTEAINGF